jgi:hypothetical protein
MRAQIKNMHSSISPNLTSGLKDSRPATLLSAVQSVSPRVSSGNRYGVLHVRPTFKVDTVSSLLRSQAGPRAGIERLRPPPAAPANGRIRSCQAGKVANGTQPGWIRLTALKTATFSSKFPMSHHDSLYKDEVPGAR